MFNWLFKRKTKVDKLRKKYETLMRKSFKLSKIDRKLSDAAYAEANKIMEQLQQLQNT